MQRVDPQNLNTIDILSRVEPGRLRILANNCVWRAFSKGESILSTADGSTDVHLLVEGRVRVNILSIGGREVALREIAAGGSFGELAAVDGYNRSATVTALEDSIIASLTSDTFWVLMREEPTVAAHVMQGLARLVRDLTNRVVETTTLTVPVRLRMELIRMARQAGISNNSARLVRFPVHADLASRIGATREAITRELGRLDRAGLIDRQGSAVVIRDFAALLSSIKDIQPD